MFISNLIAVKAHGHKRNGPTFAMAVKGFFFCFVFALLQIPKPLGSIIDFSSLACAFPAFILLSFGTTFLLPLFVYLVCRLLCFLVSSILFSTALAVVFPAFARLGQITLAGEARACKGYATYIHRYASMYIKLGCLWSDSCQLLWWHSYQLCVAHTLLPFCFPPIFFFFF